MEKILTEVQGAKSIGITGHIRPDGDCVGSCLGMAHYLRNALPEDVIIDVLLKDVPEAFESLPGVRDIMSHPRHQSYDIFIVNDCGRDRTGEILEAVNKAQKVINIDHHVSNPGSGDINYIFPEASSTCELVYDLTEQRYMNAFVAKCLYTGIIHDTGLLHYNSTSVHTLEVAADLIKYDFNFTKVIDDTFYSKSLKQQKLLAHCLNEAEPMCKDKVIVSVLDNETMQRLGVSGKDVEGIVAQLRNTRGVEVAVFMYEYKKNTWKVSLRSSEYVDVSKIAEAFGGGGHVKASGFNLEGEGDECLIKVIHAIKESI